MNINSNVRKQDNSFKILLAAIAFLSLIALFAFYSMNSAVTITAPMQTNGMSDVDQIKQKIREAESLKDSYEVAREHAAQSRDFEKSGEMAKKVAEQEALVKKLYEDLHEANIKEGDNGEGK